MQRRFLSSTVQNHGALKGIKVLDLSRVLAGPFCTMMLGDAGADVIKVESVGEGDITRTWGPPFVGTESCYFLAINRNKRSIAVDLKSKEGLEVIHKLVQQADVLVENFPPGKLDKLGLGWSQLQKLNPSLVYASITGYGPSGPYANRPGYDVIASAEGGLMSFTGEANGPPVKVGVAITDICTGLTTYGSIVTALLARERSADKKGQKIDTSLLEVQVSVLVNIASNYLNAGLKPRRLGTSHESIVPYQAFRTKDGYYVIGGASDSQYHKFCTAINREDLTKDPRFKSNADRVKNREILVPILEEVFMSKTNAYWRELLTPMSFPNGPVNDLKTVFEDPQVLHRDMILEALHPTAGLIKMLGFPVKYESTPLSLQRPPPTLGQHTKEVLQELKYSETKIESMIANSVVQ
jgi:succinate--hydroxymethylglutarate CoA-transferase